MLVIPSLDCIVSMVPLVTKGFGKRFAYLRGNRKERPGSCFGFLEAVFLPRAPGGVLAPLRRRLARSGSLARSDNKAAAAVCFVRHVISAVTSRAGRAQPATARGSEDPAVCAR
ncbi:hypothetical protein SKAU_G00010720 [Synaphobranchus kaupii]|uniref:Uncharacterized protein n=1 Tax=Synaphobranchus kaupii TaxID=118154 RepID=A0A9Q1JDH6_SYNKA|nr:hypothetical protein SKAU_G00010720 [Synaphobranchus kaupii]